jgi:hypothetical protein
MFDTLQKARFGGKPLQLFIFRRQGTEVRFCTGATDYTNPVDSTVYTAAQIERSEIKLTSERAKDTLTIKFAFLKDPNAPDDALPSTQSLGDWWTPYVPGDRIDVICLDAHRGDTDAPKVRWMGEVVRPSFSDVEITLTCAPYGQTARTRGQGYRWQKSCPKTVYSTGIRGCNLDPEDFKIEATPTVSGLQLTAAAFGTAPFNLRGGTWQWTTDAGLVEKRYILAHSGTAITLLYGGEDLDNAGFALPNCEHTFAACSARRDDPQNHYGGAVYKPIKNPTEGQSMSWG